MEYKKRPGTSGISGQFYETKIVALLLFRLLQDDDIEDFHLASNMADIGTFDDVIVKIKLKGDDVTKLVLIQAKHKESDDVYFVLNDGNNLVKWCDSVLKIKEKFQTGKNPDVFFSDDNTECFFILYTNAKYDSNKHFEHAFSKKLNECIATTNNIGCYPCYTDKNIEDYSSKILNEELVFLAEKFVMYLSKQSMNILNNEYMLKYHVILATKVVDISSIQYEESAPDCKWRWLSFREDFFISDDQNITSFRNHLFSQIQKHHINKKDKNTVDELLQNRCISAKDILKSINIKVPVAFGNKDLTVKGNVKKIERRLRHLTEMVTDLCQNAKQLEEYKVITIDNTLGELLSHNGGLGGAVGNMIVYDTKTKLLKFSEDVHSLPKNANTLMLKLKDRIPDIYEYRIKDKSVKLPKLVLDCSFIAREFMNKLIIYSKQGNHHDIENILKQEIEEHHGNIHHNRPVETNSLFLYYHNEIQKWWMTAKTGSYLTKSSDIYQQVINNIDKEPKMCSLQNNFYINNIKYFGYNYTNAAIEYLKSITLTSGIVILTDVTTLSTLKIIQYLKSTNSKYITVDLDSILNMPDEDFNKLNKELEKTEKIVIVACNIEKMYNKRKLHKRLNNFTEALASKTYIIVTNNKTYELLNDYYTDAQIYQDNNLNMADLTPESQQQLLANARLLFQGHKVTLNLLIKDLSIHIITGAILQKIICEEPIVIGETLTYSIYEDIRVLYIDRRVIPATTDHKDDIGQIINTFYDINDHIVLITADPGMGKSTLLTHLSIKTKEVDKNLWIVRINLLDHSRTFYEWKREETNIDTLISLRLICQAIIKNKAITFSLKEVDDEVQLASVENCDELTAFELNLFIHFYNNQQLLLLFDGFDEICPHYKDMVIRFFGVIKNLPRQNRMWVTSRPYSDILPDLQKVFDKTYNICHINNAEQRMYLDKYWQTKLDGHNLENTQINNVMSFIDFMSEIMLSFSPDALHFRFRRIYYIFYDNVHAYFPQVDMRNRETCSRLRKRNNGRQVSKYFKADDDDADNILGTPLFLHLIADYFVTVIKDSKVPIKWEFDINMIKIYEMFIERKLSKILFQDKNKMDMYNPDIITKYEKERLICINTHKKIAAYVLLGSPLFNRLHFEEFKDIDPLSEDGIKEIHAMIQRIKTATEKTGIITHVTHDDMPVFIHKTFAEYFTSEFICDVFQNDDLEFSNKKLLYTTTNVCHLNDVFSWISKKRETDNKLNDVLEAIEAKLPLFLTWHHEMFASLDLPLEQHIRIMNSSANDYEINLFDKYDDNYETEVLNKLRKEERDKHVKMIYEVFVENMKPDLKKYFFKPG